MLNSDASPFSTYFDGRKARAHLVRVRLEGKNLHIENQETGREAINLVWRLADLTRMPERESDADPDAWCLSPQGSEARLILRDPFVREAIGRIKGRRFARSFEQKHFQIFLRLLFLGVLIGGLFYANLGILSRWALPFIPLSFEESVGNAVYDNLDEYFTDMKLCDNPKGVAALQKMTALFSEDAMPFPLKVEVMKMGEDEEQSENAFALPGGRIIIIEGLLHSMEKPELIAGVLAHEAGHVFYRHNMQNIVQSALIWGTIGILFGDITGFATLAAAFLLNSAFSRDMEREADSYAAARLQNLRIESAALAEWFQTLAEKEDFPPYLSSHPASEARADFFLDMQVQNPRVLLTPQEWKDLRSICS